MVQPVALAGVVLIPFPVHADQRGFLAETFRADMFHQTRFVQDNYSYSAHALTLRGLHLQEGVAKLVRVVSGKIWDVVVDLRQGSPTYGSHAVFEMAADFFQHLYIPEGCAHGFLTLDSDVVVEYKLSDYFDPARERGVFWADPTLDIEWPDRPVIMSMRDRGLPYLKDVQHSW